MNALSTQAEQHIDTTQIWLAVRKGGGQGWILVIDPTQWIHYHILFEMQWCHIVESLPLAALDQDLWHRGVWMCAYLCPHMFIFRQKFFPSFSLAFGIWILATHTFISGLHIFFLIRNSLGQGWGQDLYVSFIFRILMFFLQILLFHYVMMMMMLIKGFSEI